MRTVHFTQDRTSCWHSATAKLNEQSGREFWQTFKKLTGEGRKPAAAPKLLKADGTTTSGPTEAANHFAQSLHKIHQMHTGPQFATETEDKVKESMLKSQKILRPIFPASNSEEDNEEQAWLYEAVTEDEIKQALKKSKNTSAPGRDGIKYAVLKNLPPIATGNLASIYTACLKSGYFPSRWKSAIGVMIPKPGKKHNLATNFRPISLLNTMGKTLERIITQRLHLFLLENHPINRWQKAYQQAKEGTEILYRIAEEMKISKESKNVTALVSLDVEKAFDTVWHQGLLYKLAELKLPPKTLCLIASFLNNRTISVKVADAISAPTTLQAGTPQGSVLSPLLYLLYVNDMPLEDPRTRAGQFADDLSLWTTATTKARATIRLQKPLKQIEDFCNRWKIKINVQKTQFLLTSRKKESSKHTLMMEKLPIQPTPTAKILGVTFNRTTSYKEHCSNKASEANRRINLLRKLAGQRWGANRNTLLKLYKQYIRPALEYAAVAIAEAPPHAITKMEVAERYALRVATHTPMGTLKENLYKKAQITPLRERLIKLREKTIARFDSEATDIKAIKKLREAAEWWK